MSSESQKDLPPIIIASGGTGGHLFPAQALASEMSRRGRRLILITDNRGEGFAQSFPGAQVAHIRAATFAGAGLFGRMRAAVLIVLGIFDAFRILRRERPKVVIGFGGYPSFPTMVAAMLTGVRRCVHEQNAILGRVNRAIATRINVIASTFGAFDDVSASVNKKVVVTGNPLRDPVVALAGTPYPPLAETNEVYVLVFGGSQGARILSDRVPEALALLPDQHKRRLRVVQQCRPEDESRVAEAYADDGIDAEISPFFNDMPDRIAQSHLVICRSGASTVCEVAAIGRPAIFVPLPTAMDDHQTVNASFLARTGGGWLIPQTQLTPEGLSKKIAELFDDPAVLSEAASKAAAFGRTGAAVRLADLLEDVEARRPIREVSETMPFGQDADPTHKSVGS